MNPHKVKREVLGIKLRIARSLKSDLISQFDVADMIRQELKTVKDHLKKEADGAPFCGEKPDEDNTNNVVFIEQEIKSKTKIPPNVDNIISGVEKRVQEKINGKPCDFNVKSSDGGNSNAKSSDGGLPMLKLVVIVLGKFINKQLK